MVNRRFLCARAPLLQQMEIPIAEVIKAAISRTKSGRRPERRAVRARA